MRTEVSGPQDSLFSRWSRRKLAARRRSGQKAHGDAGGAHSAPPPSAPDDPRRTTPATSKDATAPGAIAPDRTAPGEAVPEDGAEREILERLGLPDPDTLGPGDDFKAFMVREVPAFLRRRALRRLWRLDPVLANLDGLVDHGEDFHSPEFRPDILTTAYRVGKGLILQDEADRAGAAAVSDAANRSEDLTGFAPSLAAGAGPSSQGPEPERRPRGRGAEPDPGAEGAAVFPAGARESLPREPLPRESLPRNGDETDRGEDAGAAARPRPARMRFRPA